MITEAPFPHSMVRTLAQNITNDMRAVSDQIADTADPIAQDEPLQKHETTEDAKMTYDERIDEWIKQHENEL